MRALLLGWILIVAVLAAGCGTSTPSGGDTRPLQGNRIPKGAGPARK